MADGVVRAMLVGAFLGHFEARGRSRDPAGRGGVEMRGPEHAPAEVAAMRRLAASESGRV